LKNSGLLDGGAVSESSDVGASNVQEAQSDAFKVMALVRAFMSHGHLKADLDPLNLDSAEAEIDLGGFYAHPSADM
jgi:2-oxoglutarate dehydrogenase complex dehydrogenase (E1) component-like enzyme